MRFKVIWLVFFAGALVLAGYSVQAATSDKSATTKSSVKLVRYKNEQGVLVTSNNIPPELAKKGYQIVNAKGTVLEEVAPELTPEQLKQLEQDKQSKQAAAQQQEADKQLLLRYSSIDELQKSRDRKLGEIDSKIKMLQSNISTIKQQTDNEQQKAATFERNGVSVPAAILAKLASLRQELAASEEQLITRKQELEEERVRFDKEVERFTALKGRKKQ